MGEPGREGDARPGLDYYEAVPYLLVMESVEREGQWPSLAPPARTART